MLNQSHRLHKKTLSAFLTLQPTPVFLTKLQMQIKLIKAHLISVEMLSRNSRIHFQLLNQMPSSRQLLQKNRNSSPT